ncbi:hypothetical protein [Clostridium septicum]|uniref:hypothetical protein n=1 Tax=Clostridium septicum TaxID=1504 RepID=UPI003C12B5DD
MYNRRKETVERSFADSKFAWASLCSLPRTRKVSEQCLLTAAVQNMKKIATRLSLLLLDFIRIILDDILNISFIHN